MFTGKYSRMNYKSAAVSAIKRVVFFNNSHINPSFRPSLSRLLSYQPKADFQFLKSSLSIPSVPAALSDKLGYASNSRAIATKSAHTPRTIRAAKSADRIIPTATVAISHSCLIYSAKGAQNPSFGVTRASVSPPYPTTGTTDGVHAARFEKPRKFDRRLDLSAPIDPVRPGNSRDGRAFFGLGRTDRIRHFKTKPYAIFKTASVII